MVNEQIKEETAKFKEMNKALEQNDIEKVINMLGEK